MSQRARVLGVIGLTILPVVTLAAVSIWTQRADTEMRIAQERVALARAAAFATESFVAGQLSTVRSLALHPAFVRRQPAYELSVFLKMQVADHPEWDGVGITGPDGEALYVGAAPGKALPVSRSGEAASASALPLIVISVPIARQADGTATLTVPVSSRALGERLVRTLGGPPTGIEVVQARPKAHVASDGSQVRLLPAASDAPPAPATGAGSRIVDRAGIPSLAAYAPISPYGWSVVVTEPVGSVFAPARVAALERAGLLVAGLFAAAALGWYLGGRLGVFYQRAVEARAEAESAHAGLQTAIAARDRFLATLSHELRNPLAPISNAVAILDHAAEPRHAVAARDIIRRQVANMVRLIDDLLEISRIATGKLKLRSETIDIALAVRDAVETAAPALAARDHALEVRAPDGPVRVHADATRLSQVIGNLLGNAAKYTAPGGRIRLAVEALDDRVTISVKDNGTGIPPADLERIFEMFEQLEPPPDGKQEGLGVGLAVVRRLVEMHGGTVSAHSEGPGRGSEFVVRLPRAG